MHRRHVLALGLAAPLLSVPALAQKTYPNRPIQLIVPFPPGGAVDVVGRRIAEIFKDELGQPVVLVNKPGANGVIAWQSMVGTPPDGHQIFAAAGQGLGFIHLMNKTVSRPFLDDFTGIAAYANYPVVIVVSKDLPVGSLKELAEYARKNTESLGYGTTGVGSGGHFLFELYKSVAQIPDEAMPPVHYAGIAPELTALVGGHLKVAIMPLTSLAAQQIDSGAIRALAVTADNRSPFRNEIPTVVEEGYPELVAKDYLTYWVPKQTPQAIVDRLAQATRQAIEDPGIRQLLTEMYFEVEYLDGAGAREKFETRAAQFEPLIKKLNISLQ